MPLGASLPSDIAQPPTRGATSLDDCPHHRYESAGSSKAAKQSTISRTGVDSTIERVAGVKGLVTSWSTFGAGVMTITPRSLLLAQRTWSVVACT